VPASSVDFWKITGPSVTIVSITRPWSFKDDESLVWVNIEFVSFSLQTCPQCWPNTIQIVFIESLIKIFKKLKALTNIRILFTNICIKIETVKLFLNINSILILTINFIKVYFNIITRRTLMYIYELLKYFF
jgi:hypothetical protein